jgi:hypothetical protein
MKVNHATPVNSSLWYVMVLVSSVPPVEQPAVAPEQYTGVLSLFYFTPCSLRLLEIICKAG